VELEHRRPLQIPAVVPCLLAWLALERPRQALRVLTASQARLLVLHLEFQGNHRTLSQISQTPQDCHPHLHHPVPQRVRLSVFRTAVMPGLE
jgi:hypothetical protein